MRQSSPVKPLTQTAQMQLHPILQSALASLDSQLEDELARYRRQRALGKGGYPVRQSNSQKDSKTLGFTLATADELHQPPHTILRSEPFSANPAHAVDGTVAAGLAIVATATSDSDDNSISNASPELQELAKQYASKVAEETDLTDSLDAIAPGDYLESSEELLRSLAEEEADVQTEQRFMQSLLTPMGVGSMLLLLVSSVLFGFVIMNPASLTQLFASRNAKFGLNASSKATTTPSNFNGAVVGDLQPNLANQEFPDRLNLETLGSLPVDSNAAAANPTLTKSIPGSSNSLKASNSGVSGRLSKPSSSKPTVPPAPTVNQSAPDPVSVVPRKLAPAASSYSPPASSSYSPPASSYTPPASSSYSPPPPASSYSPPAKKSRVSPAPKRNVTPTPSTQSSVAPAPSSPVAIQKSEYGYKVGSPYTGDRSLEEAREKSPSAFLRNTSDGAIVQYDAYKDEAAAKARAEELRQQGVPAEVYKP